MKALVISSYPHGGFLALLLCCFSLRFESTLLRIIAEVAELVDALDSKSSMAYPMWGFESPLRHTRTPQMSERGFLIHRD